MLGLAVVTPKAQTDFPTKQDVVNYLEGEWNLDVVRGGFAGGTYYLPSRYYFDSTVHKIVFKPSGIDATPLYCTAYLDGQLYQETLVEVSMNPSQEILPRWLLKNMPNNLENEVGFMEKRGFYGYSRDTIVFGGNIPADGYEFGLTRLSGTGTNSADPYVHVIIYPNPSTGRVVVDGLVGNIDFELYDMKGALIRSGVLIDHFLWINQPGLYSLRLRVGEDWITRPVVIDR